MAAVERFDGYATQDIRQRRKTKEFMATVKVRKVVEVEETIQLALVRGILPLRKCVGEKRQIEMVPVVCFSEIKNPAHPGGGEAFVVSGEEKVIALTERALEAVGDKRIEIIKRLTDAEAAELTKAA